jgi:hypothetical protein
MLKRLAIIVGAAALALLLTASAGQASGRRHCGAIKVGISSGHALPPFQVFINRGPVSCGNARFVMATLYNGRPKHERCYRNDPPECRNGHPTDLANAVILVAGWECGTGAGGGGCSRHHAQISGEFIETSQEKTARIKREAAENEATVLECENEPDSVLIQEGTAPNYTYECISDKAREDECSQYPNFCREPMYSVLESPEKWERRIREACNAIGDSPTESTRDENSVPEYKCVGQEGSNVAWVTLPYMPPEEYAELRGEHVF